MNKDNKHLSQDFLKENYYDNYCKQLLSINNNDPDTQKQQEFEFEEENEREKNKPHKFNEFCLGICLEGICVVLFRAIFS